MACRVNGEVFAHLEYEGLGRISSAIMSDGSVIIPTYDASTLAQIGVTRFAADGLQASSAVSYNARGLISQESLATAQGTVTRTYGYTPQRFLNSSTDGASPASIMTYDVGSGMQTTATTTTYGSTDAQGRVTQRTASGVSASLGYGLDGQIVKAQIGATAITYTSDESGHRLVRRVNGAFDRAYVDSGVIDRGVNGDGGGITEPVDIAGWHVGTLRKGVFTSLATDARGTVLGQFKTAGQTSIPAPYGTGMRRLASEAVTAYAEQPLDVDLGLVRMGVRDYDPTTGRFLQPDPLYLANPSACIGDHTGCNLYSYAGNDPVNFVDPSGYNRKHDDDGSPFGDGRDPFAGTSASPGASQGVDLTGQVACTGAGYDACIGQATNMYVAQSQLLVVTKRSIDYGSGKLWSGKYDISSVSYDLYGQQSGSPSSVYAQGGIFGPTFETLGRGIGRHPEGLLSLAMAIIPIVGFERLAAENALNHVFGKIGHNLEPVVESFGSREAAYSAMQAAAQTAADNGIISDIYRFEAEIGDWTVTLGGRVMDGVAQVKTAFIRILP